MSNLNSNLDSNSNPCPKLNLNPSNIPEQTVIAVLNDALQVKSGRNVTVHRQCNNVTTHFFPQDFPVARLEACMCVCVCCLML